MYVAKIEKHRKKGLDIFESIQAADEEIRAEQAAAAPPPEEDQMMAPEQALGLAGPPQAMAPEGAAPEQQMAPEQALAEMQQALAAGAV